MTEWSSMANRVVTVESVEVDFVGRVAESLQSTTGTTISASSCPWMRKST